MRHIVFIHVCMYSLYDKEIIIIIVGPIYEKLLTASPDNTKPRSSFQIYRKVLTCCSKINQEIPMNNDFGFYSDDYVCVLMMFVGADDYCFQQALGGQGTPSKSSYPSH